MNASDLYYSIAIQEALSRRCSREVRTRRDTDKVIAEIQPVGPNCTCSKPCRRDCVLRDIVDRLRNLGYNAALCKTKWRSSPEIPSGKHSYMDVLIESKKNTKKRGPMRIVIGANFRAEFEMARANAEYNRLVSGLPEIFVGKSERLRDVIRIMCGAAKKCMKDNGMHMAPWRKFKYMQSKWLGTCERIAAGLSIPMAAAGASERPLRAPRASMLTMDLHCPAATVEVV